MNEQQHVKQSNTQASPIKTQVGSIFVPVKDIEKARSWYCQVLGLSEDDCR
ncbi:VOC family protein [Brevibacillus sp. NRS-1366]|uniref:VOC family protein n=1 Tax=Brevibacillus sp. NRS-1366 TaxID=3233899 RepID=UPI003D252149